MNARLIVNPVAGRGKAERNLSMITEYFTARRLELDICRTDGVTGATELARCAGDDDCELVIVAGGDGTINEVVNGLVGSETVLGIIPLGTSNVVARGLKLPLDIKEACQVVLEGVGKRIDVGKAGERYFLAMAGVGFDAQVVYELSLKAKNLLGSLAYVASCFRTAMKYRSAKLVMDIRVDEEQLTVPAWVVIIGNVSTYAWTLKPTHLASVDDGLLDVCIFGRSNWLGLIYQCVGVFYGRHIYHPEVKYIKAKTIEVDAQPSVPVQVDGDIVGKTPMRFEVVPRGLCIMCPKELDDVVIS